MRIANLQLTAALAAGVVGLVGMVTVLGVSAAPQPESPPAIAKAAKPAETKPEQGAAVADGTQRARSRKQMQQILLAIWNYYEANGHFPADILDKAGTPLLSWRVQVLPYIRTRNQPEQDKFNELYAKFKLEEPWDSEHNKTASATSVGLFANGQESKGTEYPVTYFQRPTGKGTAHEPGNKLRLTDIHDGTVGTIFLVETDRAVPWAKPDDLPFNREKLTELRGAFSNVIHCGTGDNTIHTFAGGMGKEEAGAAISRGGAEVFDIERYRGIGWPRVATAGKNEVAALVKELEGQTSDLMRLLVDNQKLLTELNKLQEERTKNVGSQGVVTELVDVERLLELEQRHKRLLEEALKRGKK